MERREFLLMCGCTGLGLVSGIGAARPVQAEGSGTLPLTSSRPSTWMHGSPTLGCARLPNHQYEFNECVPIDLGFGAPQLAVGGPAGEPGFSLPRFGRGTPPIV